MPSAALPPLRVPRHHQPVQRTTRRRSGPNDQHLLATRSRSGEISAITVGIAEGEPEEGGATAHQNRSQASGPASASTAIFVFMRSGSLPRFPPEHSHRDRRPTRQWSRRRMPIATQSTVPADHASRIARTAYVIGSTSPISLRERRQHLPREQRPGDEDRREIDRRGDRLRGPDRRQHRAEQESDARSSSHRCHHRHSGAPSTMPAGSGRTPRRRPRPAGPRPPRSSSPCVNACDVRICHGRSGVTRMPAQNPALAVVRQCLRRGP